MADRLMTLRALILKKPTSQNWKAIQQHFAKWPTGPERELALEYANAHMEPWPNQVRIAALSQQNDAYWPLVRRLDIREETLDDPDQLASWSHITSLMLRCDKGPKTLDWLTAHSHITTLHLSECNALEELDGLAHLPQLTDLSISDCDALTDLTWLLPMKGLTSLSLRNCRRLHRVDELSTLTELTDLSLRYCQTLTSAKGIKHLTKLQTLYVSDCKKLKPQPKRSWMHTPESILAYQQDITK